MKFELQISKVPLQPILLMVTAGGRQFILYENDLQVSVLEQEKQHAKLMCFGGDFSRHFTQAHFLKIMAGKKYRIYQMG